MPRLPTESIGGAGESRPTAPAGALFGGELPPLPASQERALIEAAAIAGEIARDQELLFAGGSAAAPLSVKQVNALVNEVLAAGLPPTFFIAGEISNLRVYDRGHAFFTLKEAGAELPCVLWKDGLARLKFRPKDGLAVIARGAVKLYEPQGKLQLYVETLLPQGAGALELAFRQLCEKLKAEGLFEPARKRPIPGLPRHVLIITSRTGDVLHDVLTTAYRRFPGLHTMLFPVRVQGEQAAPDIVRALELVDKNASRLGGVDLILLVRGGGSLEDLWAFNEEIVARAIVASKIPIATGIGHEPDTTIADLVGDLRGPTPTGVTELTIPDVRALSEELRTRAALLTRDLCRTIDLSRGDVERLCAGLLAAAKQAVHGRAAEVERLCKHIERIEPRHAIAQGWRRVEDAQRRLADAATRRLRGRLDVLLALIHRFEKCSPAPRIERLRERVAALESQLRVMSPQAVLDRGYSITMDQAGKIVRSENQVSKGDVLTTRLAEGRIVSTVGRPKQGKLF